MKFVDFNSKIKERFALMCTGRLYYTNADTTKIWDLYINNILDDDIWRVCPTHVCNNDRRFIEKYGNIVAFVNGTFMTMFDVDADGSKYETSVKKMVEYISSTEIVKPVMFTFDYFNELNYEKSNRNATHYQMGNSMSTVKYTAENAHGKLVGEEYKFYHFNVSIPATFVKTTGGSLETHYADLMSTFDVFKRGVKDISQETLELMVELFDQGSLSSPEMFKPKVVDFLHTVKYINSEGTTLTGNLYTHFLWDTFYATKFKKFRSELIGQLALDIENPEIGLEKAVLDFNKRQDPANYMNMTAPASKRQIQAAEVTLIEKGYENSFSRDFVQLDDIPAIAVNHKNEFNSKPKLKLFDDVAATNSKIDLKSIAEVSIEEFIENILPKASSVEAYVRNLDIPNFFTLTKGVEGAKPLTAWGNNVSLTTFMGLSRQSDIATNVQKAGGKIDGVLRCSLMWNESGKDDSDLDLHLKSNLNGSTEHVYFSNKNGRLNKVSLDVDIQRPQGKVAVENIVFEIIKDGVYTFHVNQYAARNSVDFKAEIVFNGETYLYHYEKALRTESNVQLAEITVKNGQFSIKHFLPVKSETVSQNVWNIDTQSFHKVDMISLSPNYWFDEIGFKQYLFVINGMYPDTPVKGFHMEELNAELKPLRRELTLLQNKFKVSPVKDGKAVCGITFTKGDIVLKVNGTHNRLIKVKI